MNILFDIGHPAHVHLFKNFIEFLKERNESVVITSRHKDVTTKLLDHYQLDHVSLSADSNSLISKLWELMKRTFRIYKYNKHFKFRYGFGTSASIGFISKISSSFKSVIFNEDDDGVVPLYSNISYPFADIIVNPVCLKYKKWEKKRVLVESYHELAYLHPNNFTPDPEILKKYNLSPRNYIIIRNSALTAHHDMDVVGLSNIWDKVYDLLQGENLIYSKEKETNHKIFPWDMHHVLSFAKLIISDSQTMTAEAAVLGVPSLRYNSFVGKIGYLEELQNTYDLTKGFKPGEEKEFLDTLQKWLVDDSIHQKWAEKREQMIGQKVDLNQWMIDYYYEVMVNENH